MKLMFFLICLLPNIVLTITVSETTTASTSATPTTTTSQTPDQSNTTFSVSTSESSKSDDDLDKGESKNPQKLEIIKQIRKINADGSYTIGYEAEDGTFKIESRDVLGNVKGTYGYIDENGEIKRVSYTANNATGLKTVHQEPEKDTETEETAQLPKYNRTFSVSTTRRPLNLSTTKSSVVQSIPRRRFHFERVSSPNKVGQEINSLNAEPTTTVVYATSISSTAKPVLLVRPTQVPYGVKQVNDNEREQIVRPDKLEISHVSKVSSSSSASNKNEKEGELKSRNHLRRQLSSENTENFETQQQIIYGQSAGDDNQHIYGSGHSSTVTVRPLFSTTQSTRVPAHIIAARQRAAQLQNILNKSPSSTTERVYAKSPKRLDDKQQQRYEQSTEPQTAGPVVEVPPPRDLNVAAEDERRPFRERPGNNYRPREFIRYVPTTVVPLQDQQRHAYRMPVPPGYVDPQEQYLRETTRAPLRRPQTSTEQDRYEQQQGQTPAPDYRKEPGSRAAAAGYPPDPYAQPPYASPYPPPYGGIGGGAYNPRASPFDYPDRPLTTRDFERLLQILIYRHTQLQQYNRFGYNNPYYPSASPYPPPNPYYGGYQIPRPPFYNPLYDPRYENPNYSPSTPVQRQYPLPPPNGNGVPPQSSTEATENEQNLNQLSPYYDSQRIIPRRRQQFIPPQQLPSRQYAPSTQVPYNSDRNPDNDDYAQNPNQIGTPSGLPDYLPPHVREDLLYRMFMLALRTDPAYAQSLQGQLQQEGTSLIQSASIEPTTIAPVTSRKPVRSVQILGEEEP